MKRACNAVDLGGNLGIHTSYMAALGANLWTVEPQPGMAEAIRDTLAANCWTSRVTVLHGGVTADASADGSSVPFRGGWTLADRGNKRRKHWRQNKQNKWQTQNERNYLRKRIAKLFANTSRKYLRKQWR